MPFSPSDVKSWLDQGLSTALSLLVVWALVLGIYLVFLWAKRRLRASRSGGASDCGFGPDSRDPKDLQQHRLFSFIRLARAFMLPNLPIPDPGRKAVFEDLQDIKFRIVSDRISRWLQDNATSLPSMEPDLLASAMLGLVASIVEEYEAEAERAGIPSVVLDKFRSWHGPRIAHLRTEIGLVCESEWIADSVARMGFILAVFEQTMKLTVLDAERTLFALNGSLTGLRYRGIMIGPCPPRRSEGGVPRGSEQQR